MSETNPCMKVDVPKFTPSIKNTVEKLMISIITIIFFYVYVFDNPECSSVILNDIKYQSIIISIICFFDFWIMRSEMKEEGYLPTIIMLLMPFVSFVLNSFLIYNIHKYNKDDKLEAGIVEKIQPVFLMSQITYCIYVAVFAYKYHSLEIKEIQENA
jgi:small-conductance mechanosensitive channel